ncbi:hypothetical protein PG991_008541 [Apiospora marii]|uniref:Succinate dehydrogenase assembly factor 4, mitochondrial n=1 Tax=Apiospora marii TaxID=335849 RepID=A0ABR1RL25_9PEZI
MAYRFLRLARPLSNLRPSSSTSTPLSATITTRRAASSFASSPAPPRLPAEQQAEFERLQRTANTQQGFNPSSTPTLEPSITVKTATIEEEGTVQPNVPLRKGAPPEFDGEKNPKTGEVGGPENEPLRWGAAGDYSFNGRVTDF